MVISFLSSLNEYEIAQIIFDYSEDIPNDFYVHIMNLVKLYYENGNNLQEIHVYKIGRAHV